MYQDTNGLVCGVNIVTADVTFSALDLNANCKCYVNINDFHELLGHPSEAIARKNANEINVKLTLQFKPYEFCALGKQTTKVFQRLKWNILLPVENVSF